MKGITALFTNDRARGGWAEIGMKRIFEHGGLVEGRDFSCQVSQGDLRPDAVVYLPGGRNIVIDAKFPTARFMDALAEEDPERRGTADGGAGEGPRSALGRAWPPRDTATWPRAATS